MISSKQKLKDDDTIDYEVVSLPMPPEEDMSVVTTNTDITTNTITTNTHLDLLERMRMLEIKLDSAAATASATKLKGTYKITEGRILRKAKTLFFQEMRKDTNKTDFFKQKLQQVELWNAKWTEVPAGIVRAYTDGKFDDLDHLTQMDWIQRARALYQ